MEASTPNPIYAKVQMFLERWPYAEGLDRKALLSSVKEIKEMNLEERDILSMADFAVCMAGRFPELQHRFAGNCASFKGDSRLADLGDLCSCRGGIEANLGTGLVCKLVQRQINWLPWPGRKPLGNVD